MLLDTLEPLPGLGTSRETNAVHEDEILPQLHSTLDSWSTIISHVVQPNVDRTLGLLTRQGGVMEGGVVLDIGANFCAYSESILDQCPKCSVIAFEPVPLYAEFCRKRLARFGRRVIAIENFAVSDENGNTTLWMSPDNLGWNTLESGQKDGSQFPINIATRTLDSYFSDIRPDILRDLDAEARAVVFMKIDTEGSEWRVLNGARGFFMAHRHMLPTLLVEIAWGPRGHPHWDREIEAFEYLFDHLGYKRVDYEVTRTADVVFMPESESAV